MKKSRILIVFLVLFLAALAVLFYFYQKNSRSELTFYYFESVKKLEKAKEKGKPLPQELVIEPGFYQFNFATYDLREEGLYRFKNGKSEENRIVYQKNPWAIVSAIAWLESPEAKTNSKIIKSDEVSREAMKHSLGLSCGRVTDITAALLSLESFKVRQVMGFNLDYDLKDGDNGHTILEAVLDGRWRLIDVDNNAVFTSQGQPLTFWEFFNLVKNDSPYEIVWLSFDQTNMSESELRQYYKKMLLIPFAHNGKRFFFTATDQEAIKVKEYSRTYVFTDRQNWFDRFYPGYGYK